LLQAIKQLREAEPPVRSGVRALPGGLLTEIGKSEAEIDAAIEALERASR
jgi:hypothetical protein